MFISPIWYFFIDHKKNFRNKNMEKHTSEYFLWNGFYHYYCASVVLVNNIGKGRQKSDLSGFHRRDRTIYY